MADTSGVNLLTGKVNLSVPLGSITGPAGFGESISLSYSTTGLLQQIKTWNQDAPTSTVGLGWSLELPYITRMGNGSLKDSFYLVSGGSTLPLLFNTELFYDVEMNLLPSSNETASDVAVKAYSYVTQATSLLQIVYFPNPDDEYWLIRDGNGTEYRYGRADYRLSEGEVQTSGFNGEQINLDTDDTLQGCALNVRWRPAVSQDEEVGEYQPDVWIGSSTETAGQEQYISVWHLVNKTSQSGQQVNYFYTQVQQNVGKDGKGLNYTVAIYPNHISVVGGGSINFYYDNKKPSEYPALKLYNPDVNGVSDTNAFQNRVETLYLYSLEFFDAYNILQNKIILNYNFLYSNFVSGLPTTSIVDTMDKRLLTSIDTFTVADVITQTVTTEETKISAKSTLKMAPSQRFDYWGLYDTDLQRNIIEASDLEINGTVKSIFRTLPTSAFSLMDIDIAGRSYNALFGHLKNIETPQGGLRWYSYSDNSLDYTNLIDNQPQMKANWTLLRDSAEITKPKTKVYAFNKKKNDYQKVQVDWKLPRPYWGADGYVIIFWEGTASLDGRRWICLQIYEWIGKWILVTCKKADSDKNDDLVFHVSDFGDAYSSFATGSGKFALMRTNISTTNQDNPINPSGNVTLFHRDLYMPGLWRSTYFKPNTPNGKNLLLIKPFMRESRYSHPFTYQQPQIVIGDSIAGVLDIFNGQVYLYSFSNNQWISYKNDEPQTIGGGAHDYQLVRLTILTASSSMIALGNSIFILVGDTGGPQFIDSVLDKNSTQTLVYSISSVILTYNPERPQPGSWTRINQSHPKLDIDEGFSESGRKSHRRTLYGIQLSIQDDSVSAQFIINLASDRNQYFVSRPVIISWDTDLLEPVVRFQKIYSRTNPDELAPKPKTGESSPQLAWGSYVTSPDISLDNGIVSGGSTLLFNISSSQDAIKKYMARYVGGNNKGDKYDKISSVHTHNIGWQCNYRIPNEQYDNDLFEEIATFDTTVGIKLLPGTSKIDRKYSYHLYQFNPYYDLLNLNPNYTNIFNDWIDQNIVLGENYDAAYFQYVVDLILEVLNDVFNVLTTVTGIIVIENAVFNAIRYAVDLTDLFVNGPQSMAYGLIESSIISGMMRNHRVGDASLGQSYLLAGTVKGEGNNQGQPSLYYRKWDSTLSQWTWITADEYNYLATLKDLKLPNFPENIELATNLSSDVYRYGMSFIPLSYKVVIGSSPDAGIYEDQIACLRNGILFKLITPPSFTNTYPIKGSSNDFKEAKLYYSLYQTQDNAFSLYASWGGLLLYQPQVTITSSLVPNMDGHNILFDNNYNRIYNSDSIRTSNTLKLCMYQDEDITGAISDYIVDKVSVDDGYQVYDTHIAYMSDRAIYQKSLGSVMYNQVNVTYGSIDYNTAIEENGWTEQYFYNGFSRYTRVPGETFDERLPYDPGTDDSNPYYDNNKNYTNADIRLNPLFGQSYCQRVLKNNSDDANGYEMMRQYSYYVAYNQTARGIINPRNIFTSIKYSTILTELNHQPLQTNGNVVTLQLTLRAPDNTTTTYIKDLIEKDANGNPILDANGKTIPSYLITTQKMFYDLTNLEKLETDNITGYETGLPISQQLLSKHYISDTIDPQDQITVTATTYAFQITNYQQQFTQPNIWLWNPVAQNITFQTADLAKMLRIPVAASATVWKSAKILRKKGKKLQKESKRYWYPHANYRWVGNTKCEYITDQSIPWVTDNPDDNGSLMPLNSRDDWQLDSYINDIRNGIIYNTVRVIDTEVYKDEANSTSEIYFQGPRITIIYDKYQAFPIASITSPNLFANPSEELVKNPFIQIGDEFTRFCSFESYEDLSNWKSMDPDNLELGDDNTLISYSLQKEGNIVKDAYYAGKRALCLTYSNDTSNTSISTPIIYWQALDSSVFTPSTLNSTPAQAVLSFYSMTTTTNEDVPNLKALNISLAVLIKQPDMTEEFMKISEVALQVNLQQEDNTWNYQQNIIDLYSLIEQAGVTEDDSYKLLIGFNFVDYTLTDTVISQLYIDTLSLVPVSSIAQFSIYNQQTKLLTASLDLNGTTSRMIYDSRRRMIGSAIGQDADQAVVSCPVMYYSREDETSEGDDTFNSDNPNSQTLIQPASGGQYFDFRINEDLMDWTDNSNNENIYATNGRLFVKPGYAAQQAFQSPYTRGVAIRAQVMPSNGYIKVEEDQPRDFRNLINTSISILNSYSYKLIINFENGDQGYQFELTQPGTDTSVIATIPNIPKSWNPDDWLFALVDQTVYFFINGQLIIHYPLKTSFSLTGLTAVLGNGAGLNDKGFSNIMLMQDPRLSSVYTDGTGKTRQTQVIADLPPSSSSSAA